MDSYSGSDLGAPEFMAAENLNRAATPDPYGFWGDIYVATPRGPP
jgi:hypothetical protein